jgi:phenylalanyl-tRNA synthetase beta chain
MRAPLSWLRDYAPLDAGVDELATKLSELGLVVEGVEHVGGGLDDVVVAEVLDIRAHPNADRIRLVDVDAGDGQPLQIACGAWNFAVGDLVPLAPVGAVLPGDFQIGRQKMRGEWSNGMLCSARELELPEPPGQDGLMILPPGLAAAGTRLVDALDLRPDVVFDLDISANRPDALCMAGVARDLAAALGEGWEPRYQHGTDVVPVDETIGTAPITVTAGDLCPRFTGTILEGVPDGPSPAWMARRLTLAGMRPISAVVDVSNYVMLDLGQPNHAYDLERLGGGGILVRRGQAGEVLETLDGVERQLGPEDCVICDAEGIAVGVGGIMGGARAEIAADTRRVLLEAAWFTPMAIARTGKRLGLHSEARVRFERGVDPAVATRAVDRFVSLLRDIGPAVRRGPLVDVVDPASLPPRPVVAVRTDRVNAVLGTDLRDADVARLLAPIGFEAVPDGADNVRRVEIPSWRLESDREIDVIEEVARMWGYGRIARTIPSGARGRPGGLTDRQRERRRIRDVLAGAGFDEAWTTTFLAPGDLERAGLDPAAVEVENPLDRSESILRTSLLPGLLKAVKFNVDRQAADVCLFEVGHVFRLPSGDAVLPEETDQLGVIVAPSGDDTSGSAAATAAVRAWLWLAEALRLQGVSLTAAPLPGWHPTRAARIHGAGGVALGGVGEVDPDVVTAYGLSGRIGFLTVSLDALAAEPRRPLQARVVSRYPASDIDLAFVVDEAVPAAAVADTLRAAAGDLGEGVWLFDVYRGPQAGPGRKSLAYRLRLRAADKTLGEAELAAARQAAIDAAVAEHGAELRS